MKHPGRAALLTAALLTSFSISVIAGDAPRAKAYDASTFHDVTSADWFEPSVKDAYECGLMEGVGDSLFSPNGTLSVAEGITVAARVYLSQTGNTLPTASGEWYAPYVKTAVGAGLMAEDTFDDYDRAITRAEAASLLALLCASFENINDVRTLPDVYPADAYYDDVLTLYRAGILAGNDAYGTFTPHSSLLRCEMSAILVRTVLPERRVRFASSEIVPARQAYLLCYTDSMDSTKEGIESGWVYDNRAGKPKATLAANAMLTDVMTDERSRLVRNFNEIEGDTLEIFTSIKFGTPFDGTRLEFCDLDDSVTYALELRNGAFNIVQKDGTLIPVKDVGGKTGTYDFRIVIDLRRGVSETIINNEPCGSYPLCGNRVRYFALCTGVKEMNTVTLNDFYAYANYAVYDDFNRVDALPYCYTAKGGAGIADMTRYSVGISSADKFVSLPQNAEISRSFGHLSGTVVFCVNTHLQNGSSGAYFTLCDGETPLVKVYTEGGKLYANGSYLRDFTDQLWHKLRIEADTKTHTALIKCNAKELATVDFLSDADTLDTVTVGNTGADIVKIDDIRIRYAEDYDIPAPVKPAGEEDFVIGMNVCSLWVNGEHWGWNCVSPYEDARPVLGYYDEGLEETVDWENKFLAEHGIDFQAFCWYATVDNEPMKTTRLAMHLDDAYLNSKYKKDVNFCILWEAANAKYPRNSHDFREYFVPYLIENYFSDPSYACIDNKLVMSIFGSGNLMGTFGTALKDEFDYLREEVKKLVNPRTGEHYDGMIIMTSNSHGSFAAYGFDGEQAYNWGTGGNSYNANVNNNVNWFGSGDVVTVPSISVGFNSRPWHGVRYPVISVDDYRRAHEWVRDDFLPNYAQKDGVTWNDHFVWLSTWNEYGEGTYIMPADKLHGFGYLDVLRDVYGDGAEHEDIVPTAEELTHINHNYPQDKRLLRSNGTYRGVAGVYDDSPVTYDFTNGTAWNSVLSISQCGTYLGTDEHGARFVTDSKNPDIIMAFAGSVTNAMSCSQIERITVTASGIPEGETMQLFFRSGVDDTLSETNSFKVESTGTEEHDFVFEVREHVSWGGKLNYLRLDPVNATDVTFSIRSIRFDMVPCIKAYPQLRVNGSLLASEVSGERVGDVDFYPFDPQVSLINYFLYAYYTWDYDSGELTLMRDGKTVTFTVGSDTAFVDGTPVKLRGEVYAVDNLPMLPIRDLAELFGFRLVYEDAKCIYGITTPEVSLFRTNEGISAGDKWYFNQPGQSQNWNCINGSVAFGADAAVISSSTWDPIFFTPDNLKLACEDYPKIEVVCSWDITEQIPQVKEPGTDTMGFYFITTSDVSWHENKHVLQEIPLSSNGEFVTMTFDMSENERWTGTMKQLRFDPFDAHGTCEVRSIRFVSTDELEPTVTDTLRNGDAENETETGFVSYEGTLAVVKDPVFPFNRVFAMTPENGRAVMAQPFAVMPSASYQIGFDLLVTGGEASVSVLPFENAAVSQTEEDGWRHYTWTLTTSENTTGSDVGFSASASGENCIIYFDNVEIKTLSPDD